MALNALNDIGHWFGQEPQIGPTGDLASVSGPTRSQQRVLRRLMTNPGAYLAHPEYGAGLGQYVGAVLDIAAITAVVRGQLALESSVAKSPTPSITITPTSDGLTCSITYTSLPDQQPVTLEFDVTP